MSKSLQISPLLVFIITLAFTSAGSVPLNDVKLIALSAEALFGSQSEAPGHERISLQFLAVMNWERCLALLVAINNAYPKQALNTDDPAKRMGLDPGGIMPTRGSSLSPGGSFGGPRQ